jgi:hypothetical protein
MTIGCCRAWWLSCLVVVVLGGCRVWWLLDGCSSDIDVSLFLVAGQEVVFFFLLSFFSFGNTIPS